MLAYDMALQVPVARLVCADSGSARTRRIRHTGKAIVEWPIDLAAEPPAVLDRIDALAQAAMGAIGSGDPLAAVRRGLRPAPAT